MKKKLLQGVGVLLGSLLFMVSALAEMVNINKADAAALQANLTGIGAVKAKAIVDYRKANGSFQSIDDLKKVNGIGEATFKKLKKDVSLTKGVTTEKKSARQAPAKVEDVAENKSSHDSNTSATSKDTKPASNKTTQKPTVKVAQQPTEKKSSTDKVKTEANPRKVATKETAKKSGSKQSNDEKRKNKKTTKSSDKAKKSGDKKTKVNKD